MATDVVVLIVVACRFCVRLSVCVCTNLVLGIRGIIAVICECVRSLSLFASVCVSPTEPIAQGSTNAMQIQCTKTRRLFKLDCGCGCTHGVLLQPRQTKDCTKTIQKHKLKTVQTKVVGTYVLAMIFPSWHKSYTIQAKKKRIRNSTHI